MEISRVMPPSCQMPPHLTCLPNVEEPMKYQALRPQFFSVGRWRWWNGCGGVGRGGGGRVGGGGSGVGVGRGGVVGWVMVGWGWVGVCVVGWVVVGWG